MPEQRDTPSDRIEITALLTHLGAIAAFSRWTVPAELQAWWPPVADVDPREGGSYHFSWPSQGWHLRGIFTRFEPGRRLAYTWRWDHDPADAETVVDIVFRSHPDGGTALSLTHGPYPATDAGWERRQEHLDGWMYFLDRLENTRTL
jgi:uncharacterized protein YndB with AHSA1/START domain